MNRIPIALCALFALIQFAAPARAGWDVLDSGTTADLHDLNWFQGTWVAGDAGTLRRSDDFGLTWAPRAAGTAADLHAIHMPSSSNYWLGGSGGTVLVSLDAGVTWDARGVGDGTAQLRALFSRSSGIAFAAGLGGRTFYTDDTADTWDAHPVATSADFLCGLAPTSGGLRAVVAGTGGAVYYTYDAGASWTPAVNADTADLHDMCAGAGGTLIAVGSGGAILRSADLGETWTSTPSPTLATLNAVATSAANVDWVMACGNGGTVIKSTDGGLTWGLLATPVTADLNALLSYSNSDWLACGEGGVMIKTTDGGGTIVAVEDAPPPAAASAMELEPAAPNPFNPQTTLSYRLDAPAHVRLDIHAVDGRRVRSLPGGPRTAGRHSVNWDGRDDAGRELPSGVYLVRLRAGETVRARRVQLVR